MATHVTEISTPPTPMDPPAEFEQKAARVWSELHQAVPQMNQQADDIEQIGATASASATAAAVSTVAAKASETNSKASETKSKTSETNAKTSETKAKTSETNAKTSETNALNSATAAASSAASAAESVGNRVAKTGDTGAALLPEGNNAQRPATGSIPAGALVMRGNAQTAGDYIAEYWDRGVAAWRAFASRTWVSAQITTAINALQTTIDGWLGYAIVYPNGGSAASPANVALNSRYVTANPFPDYHVMCEAQVLYAGAWSSAGWYTNNTAAVGVVAHQVGNDIVTITGQTGTLPRANLGGNAYGIAIGADITTPVPCRVMVRRIKGAF